MPGIRLTQRQINLGLLLFLSLAGFAQAVVFFIREGWAQQPIAFGSGALLYALLFVTYQRGWEPARYLAVIIVVGLLVVFLEEPFLSQNQTMEIFLPPVVALILVGPFWAPGAGALVMGIIALRTGGQSVYLTPDNLLTYAMIVGGMFFSRLAVDNAQRLADANIRAATAHTEAEQRAEELARRNQELQDLLAQNAAQRDAIRELSVPLLPIAEQTLVLPLVGALDTARLLMVQERALATIYERRVHTLIVDVTGVPVIDTQVARGLIEMVHAVRLLGARVLLVGIRGEVASTLVELGLELKELAVYRDVQAALAQVWDKSGRSHHHMFATNRTSLKKQEL